MSSDDSRPDPVPPATPRLGWRAIHPNVWALGFVSMLMDISSEMIHALLPVYMVGVLGTSVLAVGIIEGVALATASVAKVLSGLFSDRMGQRKRLALLGYGLAALTKPVFPLASSLDWLVGARFVDRIGKGIRGAPRDALVADVTAPELRGAAYGLRQTLDMTGAFIGPLLAIGLMWLTADHFRTVFWVAVLPAFLAVLVLALFVREPARPPTWRRPPALDRATIARLGAPFWQVVALGTLFSLARFSEAFLVLRGTDTGLAPMWAPLVLVALGLTVALLSYPAGVLSDRHGRTAMLAIGLGSLLAGDLVLAFVPGLSGLVLGIVLWGAHLGFTQGVFNALVADRAPTELRGTAFGVFNLCNGLALLLASLLAGALWDAWGYQGTFVAGATFCLLTLLGLGWLRHGR